MASCTGATPEEIFKIVGYTVVPATNITTGEGGEITNGNPDLQILGAISRNASYVEQLRKRVGAFYGRVDASKLKSGNKYYNKSTGKYQNYPPFGGTTGVNTTQLFLQIAEQLAVLVYNKVISSSVSLGVDPVDAFTGEFCLNEEREAQFKISQALGIPTHGLLTVSQRVNNIEKFGYTHTGVDLTASAIFGNKVVPVKGLTAFSWSLHRDKNADRRLFEKKPQKRSRGAMTVAGSLIFAIFDEDPLRGIAPNEFFHGQNAGADSSGFTEFAETLGTDMPAFDLNITLSNEYGSTSSMTVWGVDITDAGGAISMRQLENELMVNYVATSIDPLKATTPNTDGILSIMDYDAQSKFEKKRRMTLYEDYASRNFEEMYNSTIDSVFNSIRINTK